MDWEGSEVVGSVLSSLVQRCGWVWLWLAVWEWGERHVLPLTQGSWRRAHSVHSLVPAQGHQCTGATIPTSVRSWGEEEGRKEKKTE